MAVCRMSSAGEGSDGLPTGAPTGNSGAWMRTSGGCPTAPPGSVKCLYPKLQLVQIGNVCYALNQSCLQIYQMLQQSGRSQLMQVDVVPLSKLPTSVQQSLTSSPESKMFRIFDVMGAAEATITRCPSNAVSNTIKNASCTSSHVKRVYKEPVPWWSRLFSFNSKQYERHEIVKKLIEQVMDDGANGRHPSGLQRGTFNAEASCQSSDTDSELSFVCVVCGSSFVSHRQLQRHRERASHFGCSICNKEFTNTNSLQDHWELLSHWSEDEEDYDDEFSDLEEYFYSGDEDWNAED